VSRRRAAGGRRIGRGEEGFTLTEMMIAGIIASALLVSSSIAMTITNRASDTESTQGATTNEVLLAAQAVQSYLSGAWTSSGSLGGVSTACSGGSTGQLFPATQGPFVSASKNDIMFCGFRSNSSTSDTYEIHFTRCTAAGVCTLQIDQEPGPGCSPCTVDTVFTVSGVSDAGTPFTYWDYNSGWSQVTTSDPVPSTQLASIQAVQVSLTTVGTTGAGTNVKRLVLLPNTLSGGS